MTLRDDINILAHATDYLDPEIVVGAYSRLTGLDEDQARIRCIDMVLAVAHPLDALRGFRLFLLDEGFILRSEFDALEASG